MIITDRKGEFFIESRSTIVGGDIHNPQHSWDMIDQACNEGCKVFIDNGDFWNLDSMSEFQRKQANADFKTEIACGRMILRRLLDSFQDVILIPGNHGNRINKATGQVMTIKYLVDVVVAEKDKDRVHVTDRDYVYLDDGVRRWRICHGREYSRKPGTKAQLMGEKYNCSVILGHSHILSCKQVFKGMVDHYYIDGGCMLDFNKVEYENMNTSTFTNWANGYVRLVDGNVVVRADDPIKWIREDTTVNGTGKHGYKQVLWERMR